MSNNPRGRGRPRYEHGTQLNDLEQVAHLPRRVQALMLNLRWRTHGQAHSHINVSQELHLLAMLHSAIKAGTQQHTTLSVDHDDPKSASRYAETLLEGLPPAAGDTRSLRRHGRHVEAEVAQVREQVTIAVRRIRRLAERQRALVRQTSGTGTAIERQETQPPATPTGLIQLPDGSHPANNKPSSDGHPLR